MMKTFTRAMRYTTLIAIALLMIQCGDKQNNGQGGAASTPSAGQENKTLNFAYVNDSTLMANYDFAKATIDKAISLDESFKATETQKGRQLQKEVDEFNRKLQNNAFLSRERAEQEAARVQRKEVEMTNYLQNEYQQVLVKKAALQAQLTDSINTFFKEYSQMKGYDVVLFKNATYYINPAYDVTDEVVELLNKRYAASNAAAK